MEISITEENYLKAIFSLQTADKREGVSTNQLSEHLHNKAASVTDMLKRLSEKKLINYQKYKGVALSSKGHKLAVKVVRKHRLWEVFLQEKLHFKWDEVHDMAEQLEHIHSDELISRLDKFLGYPKFDPHGDPIPDEQGNWQPSQARLLTDVKEKGIYKVCRVTDHSKSFLTYLTDLSLNIGDIIKIEGINTYDDSYKIKLNNKNQIFLSQKAASHILVLKRHE
jgi:DtxR family transcriptional regulator, Mn-dependent transcriptional regulator